jgi:SAM-dependent methyltransferase
MAHQEQQEFFTMVKTILPEHFKNCSVLDVGSLDINGNNRYLFEDYSYIGIDIGKGKNVDIVCKGHEYKSDTLFDVVISSECFEHDMYYKQTILNCINLLKSGGLFLFSCATTGRPEHGTSRTSAWDSPFTWKEFNDYYKNLTKEDIMEIVNFDDVFEKHYIGTRTSSHDLYFYGIKK